MKPKLKPILFSTPMVKAILEGRKTQTRRIVKPHPNNFNEHSFIDNCNFKNGNWCLKHKIQSNPERFEITDLMKSKYEVDDIIWVRETAGKDKDGSFFYKADGIKCNNWTPPIFMPYEAARIFLKVTNVRIERLNEISEEDAKSEGVIDMNFGINGIHQYKSGFESLWKSINGKGSWSDNHFVWVIQFERCDKPKLN